MKRPLGRFAPAVFVLALLLVFVGERMLPAAGPGRWIADGLGLAGVLAVLLVRLVERSRARGVVRAGLTPPLVGYALTLVALALVASTDAQVVDADALGLDRQAYAAWRALGTVAWVILLLVGGALGLATEWARAGLDRADRVEIRRVRAAGAGAVSLALAISWVFALNYVAARHDRQWDWGLPSVHAPSDGTTSLARDLGEDVEVLLFFPPASEVLEEIAPYFRRLGGVSQHLSVRILDHALEPRLAEQVGARRNGLVVLRRGADKQLIELGVDHERAKRKVRDLDRRFQEALLRVARERRTVYRTIGHGELGPGRSESGRPTIAELDDVLRRMNVTRRELGLERGLGAAVPADAGVVAILGPDAPFLPEEVEALRAFYRRGGSLLVLLEPGADHGLGALLADLGVGERPGVVCHDRHHLRRSGGPADRALLYSNRFGNHPPTAELAQLADRAAVVLLEAGALERLSRLESADGVAVGTRALVRPMEGSYLDADGDRTRSEGEAVVGEEALALAATRGQGDEQGRAVVVADTDLAADGILSNPANLKLLVDSFAWLAREDDAPLRVTTPPEDPPLRHTRDQDIGWFWSTVAGVPLLVLVGGLALVRRRRRSGGAR